MGQEEVPWFTMNCCSWCYKRNKETDGSLSIFHVSKTVLYTGSVKASQLITILKKMSKMVMLISFRIPVTPKHKKHPFRQYNHLNFKFLWKCISNISLMWSYLLFLLMNNKRHYSFLHHRKKTNTSPPRSCPKTEGTVVSQKVFIISRLWAKKCSAPFQLTVFFSGFTWSKHEISHQSHCAKSEPFFGLQSSPTLTDHGTFQLNNSTRLQIAEINIHLINILLHWYRHLGWFLHSLLFVFNDFREDYYNRLRIVY